MVCLFQVTCLQQSFQCSWSVVEYSYAKHFKSEYVTCLGRRPRTNKPFTLVCCCNLCLLLCNIYLEIFVRRGVYESVLFWHPHKYALESKVRRNLIEPPGLQGREVPERTGDCYNLRRTEYSWAIEAEISERAPCITCIVFSPQSLLSQKIGNLWRRDLSK